MKKILCVIVFVLALVVVPSVYAAQPTQIDSQGVEVAWQNTACVEVKDGLLTYSPGHYLYDTPLTLGFDPYGYNYQAHMFKGSYANAYLGGYGFPPYEGDDTAYLADNPAAANTWVWPYRSTELEMKWNEAWLANVDCNNDGKLDRANPYRGSGAWITNHMWDEGWNWFTKIIAAPSDATNIGGVWYLADGTEMGAVIWTDFATVQSVYNEQFSDYHGLEYLSPAAPGFGQY